ncbi:hypothetical protein PR202_gb08685 [Eleusine coracana subsp. coracana]|uniref:CHORD domain-containing protein n=1 Tax=Eleusine coracana subsp. coracana TaxID=191504 RepID=A0AAV5ECW6_ELECO|nr:hypothetical protein PR202_gb08685 [Eleusine coracana subsp. coracana]
MSATEEAAKAPVRCQRIGCDATFTEDNNPEGSCQYHPSVSSPSPRPPFPESPPCLGRKSSSRQLPVDGRSQPKVEKPAVTNDANKEPVEKPSVPAPKKKIDINEPRVCKNKGCGKLYKEKDNHDSACEYHPGPAVFHDRMRGWKCCDVHVKEFDEFMEIPPCAKGWHNADAA